MEALLQLLRVDYGIDGSVIDDLRRDLGHRPDVLITVHSLWGAQLENRQKHIFVFSSDLHLGNHTWELAVLQIGIMSTIQCTVQNNSKNPSLKSLF